MGQLCSEMALKMGYFRCENKTRRIFSHCSYFISYNSYTLHSITLHKIIYVSGLNEDKTPIKGYLFVAFKAFTI